MKAAIALDKWKLPIFKKHLDKAGFKYTKHPGLTKDSVTLTVKTESISRLKPVVIAANSEAARTKVH